MYVPEKQEGALPGECIAEDFVGWEKVTEQTVNTVRINVPRHWHFLFMTGLQIVTVIHPLTGS